MNTLHLNYTKVGTGFSLPVGVGGGGWTAATDPQLNSIFSAKTDPRENTEKKAAIHVIIFFQSSQFWWQTATAFHNAAENELLLKTFFGFGHFLV
jgi:hypothetical protein